MQMEVVYMQASETCLCVTEQYSDPETAHNTLKLLNLTVKEVQDQLVWWLWHWYSGHCSFLHIYKCINSNPSNALQQHMINPNEVPEQFLFAVAFPPPPFLPFTVISKQPLIATLSGQTKYQKSSCFTCQPKLLVKKRAAAVNFCITDIMPDKPSPSTDTQTPLWQKGGNHAQVFQYYVARVYNTVMSHVRANLYQEWLMIQADSQGSKQTCKSQVFPGKKNTK